MPEKDAFGDKLKEKERAEEDLYFAQRDREALEKLRGKDVGAQDAALLARGRCPRDGEKLSQRSIDGIEVEECGSCRGIWLDKGDLESLSRHENTGWIGKLFRNSVVQ